MYYVGIDLGTTNSAIASFDGEQTRIWKSPEQNDVTPSVIYIGTRGRKFVGKRAYDISPSSPDNTASLFKRLMGSSTPVHIAGETMSPEQCSAEVLKALFGYLPEEFRNDEKTGVVITVPAAFNQMQKTATMQAAELAGIGRVALMQEPVAAVMSVMKGHNADGTSVIYDLGGGTLDVAIADNQRGSAKLLAQGGLQMSGGRDWDRALVDNIVNPWLSDNFDMPDNFATDESYRNLARLAAWAAERAKIELSSAENSVISLSEPEIKMHDLSGKEIYLEVELDRSRLSKLIEDQVTRSVESVRQTLTKSGLSEDDIEHMVFVGGPTNYKPLRDSVLSQLGIVNTLDSTSVNPMTAVCEGAALFAETIDWSSKKRSRKSRRAQTAADERHGILFQYDARTPKNTARIVVQLSGGELEKAELQIDSQDTGWSSGKLPLKHGEIFHVPLGKDGENTFKVFAFTQEGRLLELEQDKIVIKRTVATVDAIPASHSIGIEALEKLGGIHKLTWLVQAGDPLPHEENCEFKTVESIKAGSTSELNIKLFEGEIEDPVKDNRFIGGLRVSGSDFEEGVIPAGAVVKCKSELLDSGIINLAVSVPSISATFSGNFYSPQEGRLDFSSEAALIAEQSSVMLTRLEEVSNIVDDPKLEQARQKLLSAKSIDPDKSDVEQVQQANEDIQESKLVLAAVSKAHQKEIRQLHLDQIKSAFDTMRDKASPSQVQAFDNLCKTAQREIDQNRPDFEAHLRELRHKLFDIQWRQDAFVIGMFRELAQLPFSFSDSQRFEALVEEGKSALRSDKIDRLREIVMELFRLQMPGFGSDMSLQDTANIVRG